SGRKVEVIDLAEIARGSGIRDQGSAITDQGAGGGKSEAGGPKPEAGGGKQRARKRDGGRQNPEAVPSHFEPRIVTMLFADAKGFSALAEPQIPPFVRRFLGAVADTVDRAARAPLLKNTWGDGLYFVFDSARDAALFALDLADTIAATDWSVWGLPR